MMNQRPGLGIDEKDLDKMMKKKSALKIKPDGKISTSSDEEKSRIEDH